MTRSHPIIAVHGGAGAPRLTGPQRACLRDALRQGFVLLASGAAAVQGVETAIRVLEESGLFNAGLGARAQLDGIQRLDAAIMEGRDLKAGAVAAIEGIRHPITVARLVMEETSHVLLVGSHATRFARHFKVPRMARRNQLPGPSIRQSGRTDLRMVDLHERLARAPVPDLETVGAVARDHHGTVAAGASTGGIAVMLPGRVGDTPLIGCGVYADNETGAVSMTGVGETIIRIAVAKEIVDALASGDTAGRAASRVLNKLVHRINGSAGALVLASDGRLAIRHTTPRMAAGYWDGRSRPTVRDCFR